MSIDTRTERGARAHDRPDAAAGPDDVRERPGRTAPRRRKGHLLQRIARPLTSRLTAIVLMLALGGLTLIGTLLEQAPDWVRDDPRAYADWLAAMRPRFGFWTDLLARTHLFTVFHSVLFGTVAGLLALSTLASSISHGPRLWRRATRAGSQLSDATLEHTPLQVRRTLPDDPDDVLARAADTLRRNRFRVLTDSGPDGVRSLCADRFRFAPLGVIAAHLGFVAVLAGISVSSFTAFRDSDVPVVVGTAAEIGHGTGMRVAVDSFVDRYDANGAPTDYSSDLVLSRDGVEQYRGTARVNHPLRHDGLVIYQSSFGVAAAMRVEQGGTTLVERDVPLQWGTADGTHAIGSFTVPGRDLTVFVVSTVSGRTDPQIAPGQVQLRIVRSGEPGGTVGVQVVSAGRPVTVDGLRYTFVRERQYSGLTIAHDPGKPWVWAGAVAMVGGMLLTMMVRHRRIWVRTSAIRPSAEDAPSAAGAMPPTADPSTCEVVVASSQRHDARFEAWFHRLADEITTRKEAP